MKLSQAKLGVVVRLNSIYKEVLPYDYHDLPGHIVGFGQNSTGEVTIKVKWPDDQAKLLPMRRDGVYNKSYLEIEVDL